MTASKTKYYFRKKPKSSSVSNEQALQGNSSTDSDEFSSKIEDSRRVTLHVITNPGQSASVSSSFLHLVGRLDSSLDVICVSERFKPLKPKEAKQNPAVPRVPAIAVVLFFKDEFNLENPASLERDSNNNGDASRENDARNDAKLRNGHTLDVRNIFTQKPWRFHHKVAVTGKLISCDSNRQDYFEFNYCDVTPTSQSRGNGRKTTLIAQDKMNLFSTHAAFPLWGVRKVHYGKQILRFTLFVSQENWEDQISFYKLILRSEVTKIRDDFCYFETYSNARTVVQIGLKKLPVNLKPQPLSSSILQFKVKNVGQLVPLLPNSCEPISELRWRTRDHDSNLILLQIHRSPQGVSPSLQLVEKVFTDHDSSDSRERSSGRSRGVSPVVGPPNPRRLTDEIPRSMPASYDAGEAAPDANRLNESFVCPSLPEKMPLLKPALYFAPTNRCSSTSSTTSSERHSSTSPDNYVQVRHFSRTSTPKSSLHSGSLLLTNGKLTTGYSKSFNSSSEEGFYV